MKFKLFLQRSQGFQHRASEQRCPSNVSQTYCFIPQKKISSGSAELFHLSNPGTKIFQPPLEHQGLFGWNKWRAECKCQLQQSLSSFTHGPSQRHFQLAHTGKIQFVTSLTGAGNWGFAKEKWPQKEPQNKGHFHHKSINTSSAHQGKAMCEY